MNRPDPDAISAFLREQYALWNQGRRSDLLALFRQWAPQGMTIEFVGGPVLEGWKAMNDIWDEHGGHVTIEVVQILVNGNEAAVHALNHHRLAGGANTTRPSIEIYRFTDETLQIRYFYPTSS
jgi:SnoaL-like domain